MKTQISYLILTLLKTMTMTRIIMPITEAGRKEGKEEGERENGDTVYSKKLFI